MQDIVRYFSLSRTEEEILAERKHRTHEVDPTIEASFFPTVATPDPWDPEFRSREKQTEPIGADLALVSRLRITQRKPASICNRSGGTLDIALE